MPDECVDFGPRAGGVGQDVVGATDADVNSGNDDFAARAARRKAEKRRGGKDGDGGAKKERDKAKGGGQTLNRVKQNGS